MLVVRFVLDSSASVNGLVVLPKSLPVPIDDGGDEGVITADGQTYERSEIERWFALKSKTKRAPDPPAAGAETACEMPSAALLLLLLALLPAPEHTCIHTLMQYIRTHTHLQRLSIYMCYIMHIP